MFNELPVISCVCVTRNKPVLLKRAIECFLAQSYKRKELIIVCESDDPGSIALAGAISEGAGEEIRVVTVNAVPKTTLGELRNIGIKAASGEFICQWDDDDWYHKDRLMAQCYALREHGRDGAILTQWLVFDDLEKKAYISNMRLWEGSILCRKTTLQLMPYERKHLGEDTATVEFLAFKDSLHLMKDVPGLYIYIYHGANTWNYEHWNFIFECSKALSIDDSLTISDILAGRHSVHTGSLLLNGIIERQYRREELPVK